MNILKQVVKYENTPGTFEATWVEQEVVPAVGTEGEEGYQPEQINETLVKCTAYSGDQFDLFRADVAQFGGEVDEALMAEIESEWVPPAPVVQPEVQPVDPVEKLRQFLSANPDVAAAIESR